MNCKFFVVNMLTFNVKIFHSEISILRFKSDKLIKITYKCEFTCKLSKRTRKNQGQAHEGAYSGAKPIRRIQDQSFSGGSVLT